MTKEIGVATVPGSSFYCGARRARRSYVRFAFCKKRETLERAAERLAHRCGVTAVEPIARRRLSRAARSAPPITSRRSPARRRERPRRALGSNAGAGIGAQEIALPHLAPERAQPLALFRPLDALGDRLDPERPAERDDRADQHRRRLRTPDGVDEGPVDLQDVDRELLQVPQR